MAKTICLTKQDVVNTLRNALDLDGSGTHDSFDLFISRPIQDPSLEAVRVECLAVCLANLDRPHGRDFNEKAEQWIRNKLSELQSS